MINGLHCDVWVVFVCIVVCIVACFIGFGGIVFNPLNAASVYIRSKITSAYRGERIYTLTIVSATGQTLPILWHA